MEENEIIREVSSPFYDMRGWLKFIGVASIVAGALSALSIFGIIFAWVPIWMGITLYNSSTKIETAYHAGDKIMLMEAIVVGLVGGILGYVIGNGIAWATIPVVISGTAFAGPNWSLGGISIILAVALSLLASLYPALKASRLDPSTALRAL